MFNEPKQVLPSTYPSIKYKITVSLCISCFTRKKKYKKNQFTPPPPFFTFNIAVTEPLLCSFD